LLKKLYYKIEKKNPVHWDSMTTIVFIFEKFSHPGDKEKKTNKYKSFLLENHPILMRKKKMETAIFR
jgi:hypothetical protein